MTFDKSAILVLSVAACIICCGRAYATQAEFKMMRQLEKQEKSIVPLANDRSQFQYTAEGLRDPFASLIVKDEALGTVRVSETVELPPPKMTVQGIIWGGVFPQAIINAQLVKVGDKTSAGGRITRIDKEGISFEFNGHEYRVPSPATEILSGSVQEQ